MQELVDAGEINESDAEGHPRANIITRAVGDQAESVELDKVIGSVADGDRFLLCSDGLSKVLDDNTILGLLAASPVEETAEKLVDATLDRNATDNVTAVVMQVVANERD